MDEAKDEPEQNAVYHVIANHEVCYMADRPHDDPTGCPTCKAKNPSDTERCGWLKGWSTPR